MELIRPISFIETQQVYPQLIPLSLPDLIDELFSFTSEEILFFFTNNVMIGLEVDLLYGIWNHPSHSHEQKVKLIEDIAPHISFLDSMYTLFETDPLSTFFILISLKNKSLAKQVLQTLLTDIKGYHNIIKAWYQLAIDSWDDPSLKSEPLERLLDIMTFEQRFDLFFTCCKEFFTEDVAKVSSLLVSADYTAEFVNTWGDHFGDDIDLAEKLCAFVKLIIAESNPCQTIPPILEGLIYFETEENSFDQILSDNLDKFSGFERTIISVCIDKENRSF